jgi:hypothetical protein
VIRATAMVTKNHGVPSCLVVDFNYAITSGFEIRLHQLMVKSPVFLVQRSSEFMIDQELSCNRQSVNVESKVGEIVHLRWPVRVVLLAKNILRYFAVLTVQ